MIIAKFGGTSVGSAKNIRKVIEIISQKPVRSLVVVSAMGGITNKLVDASTKAAAGDRSYEETIKTIDQIHLNAIEELFKRNEDTKRVQEFLNEQMLQLRDILKGVFLVRDLSEKSIAKVLSTGEILSSFMIAEAMKTNGLDAELKDSRDLIKTDEHFVNAEVDLKKTFKNIRSYFSKTKNKITILPGFISSDDKGETTTLGRGGSDYTAAILANAVDAEVLEIWTDVSGMFTANPKLVKQAKPIHEISYQEAMELSHFGAKVIYPPTIQPALDKKIPILIKNTMAPDEKGTRISDHANGERSAVKGISHIEDISLLTLQGNGMVGVPGISRRLFGALADKMINVKFITQASSEHSISLAVDEAEVDRAKKAVDTEFEYEILQHKIKPLEVEKNLAIIALVGDRMKSHQGISGKMFSELGNNNVNIRAIAQGSTEKNISTVIAGHNIKKALNTLHAAFFENHIKLLNLFVVGVGNVGAKLLEQIRQQQNYLLEHQHLNIRVTGISNSKKMIFDEEGIDLDQWQELLDKGQAADLDGFYKKVKELNLRNSVFVDNTANDRVPEEYSKYLKDSVAVVACNKIACSSAYENYRNLKYLSRKYNAPFLFETNVGAGLPIINTLENLVSSGDEITRIQAVLSGSLNFIFNHFDEHSSFYDVVKRAGTEGYTEPDPRIDLSGVDVMRKILILIRESGKEMELEDIENKSFLPERSLKAGSVQDFMETLKTEAAHFEALRDQAVKEGKRLKYVAEYKNGKAAVGLQMIAKDHSFYNLDGKDNIVLFYTNRYADQPLIIKGAGAGADVTASGIFGDIIKTGNR